MLLVKTDKDDPFEAGFKLRVFFPDGACIWRYKSCFEKLLGEFEGGLFVSCFSYELSSRLSHYSRLEGVMNMQEYDKDSDHEIIDYWEC